MHEKILIIDFGSQYTQLIARRIRELNILSEIYSFDKIPKIDNSYSAVILSGSPFSVLDKNSPIVDLEKIRGKVPLLAICYGAQLIAKINGGDVLPSKIREYGRANLSFVDSQCKLFSNISKNSQVWMSHGDTISKIPNSFQIIASTNNVDIAAYKINDEQTYGLQFHPEVYHSKEGKKILQNFLINICNFSQDWTSNSFVEEKVLEIKKTVKEEKVILGLSGGVDSSVAQCCCTKL